jgi:PTS system nitrogen regulatory IIA component
MKVSDFLSPADIILDVRASDKARLLKQLSAQAASKLGMNQDDVWEAIAKRETLGSTGVGNGIALPHARIRGLDRPFGILVRLHHAIDFEAVDERPVDVVFFLLLPAAGDDIHLNALACAARKLRNPETLRRIRDAVSSEAVFYTVTDAQPV